VNNELTARELGMYSSGHLLEIVRQFPPFGYPRVITIYAGWQGDIQGLGRADWLKSSLPKATVGANPTGFVFGCPP